MLPIVGADFAIKLSGTYDIWALGYALVCRQKAVWLLVGVKHWDIGCFEILQLEVFLEIN